MSNAFDTDDVAQIVLAWTERATALKGGRRVEVAQPFAVMWSTDGTEDDYQQAVNHAESLKYDNARAFAYSKAETEPLERARREIIGRSFDAHDRKLHKARKHSAR